MDIMAPSTPVRSSDSKYCDMAGNTEVSNSIGVCLYINELFLDQICLGNRFFSEGKKSIIIDGTRIHLTHLHVVKKLPTI